KESQKVGEDSEDDRLRIRVFAGGKEKPYDDVAGQILDVKFIDFDTVYDFTMIITIDSAYPGVIFNINGERSSHVFDDDSILTGSEGGDIRVEHFKNAFKSNQIKVGVDKSMGTFYNQEYNDENSNHKVGGTFLINDLKIYSPKKPGDINIIKNVLTLFKDHINGTNTLSDSEKAVNLTKFYDNWDDNYEPVFNEIKSFIDAYATANDPIFKSMDPVDPNTFSEETTIQVELQNSLHNNYFIKENINKDSFVNFKYDDADVWPGPVSASATRLKPTITIDATYNTDPGYFINGQDHVYRMTGYYAAPGELISLNVDSSVINSNLIIEIGTSTFPLGSGTRNRFQNVFKSFRITSQEFKIASPFGGPIYIKVPDNTNLGDIDITLDNVVKMPFFSIKTGSETSLSEYKEELAKGHVKWVDWESDNFLTTITLPMANLIEKEVGDPTSLMSKWSDTFQVFQDVSGRPSKRIRAEYIRFDRMNPVGGTWAGASYPMYLYENDPTDPDDASKNTHVINVGFQASNIYAGGDKGYDGEHFIILHEMGHVHNMPTLPDEVESNVNFPAVAVYNLVFNETIDKSFAYSLQQRYNREEAMMDWFISPNFRIGNGMHYEDRSFDLGAPDFRGNEMMYQSRGHGKYVELGALFGWESVGKINKYYHDLGLDTSTFQEVKTHDPSRDEFIINASKTLEINLTPLFDIWGMVPEKSTIRELNVLESSNVLASSNLIKNRIINYRSIVPRNKSEFVDYLNKLIEAGKNGDGNRQRWEAMAGSGYGEYPEYTEKIANEIIAQIDLILCRYYNTNCTSDDLDGDGIINTEDNCPETANKDQADADDDGIGDVCDSDIDQDDIDGDTIPNADDNCPETVNEDQNDFDGDGIGDVCDDDVDGDGVLNEDDNCSNTPAGTTVDVNGCEVIDGDDKDGDGILNDSDNCPETANEDQNDFDGDGIGDVCDDDDDGDGILNVDDNCPNTPDGTTVDVNGCEVFDLPLTNNKVSVTSASCIGTTDGSIGLSIEDTSYAYSVTVTGKDDPFTLGGETKTASVTGLGTGTYTVCFKVDGQDAYEQCFEVSIAEPKALSAFIDVDNDNRTTSIQLSGSSSYNVEVNGQRFDVKGDRFTTNLPSGLSIIKISTDLDCQGVIEREVFISEDIHYYPNPTQTDVNVHVSGDDTMVQVSVFSEKGDLIYSREQQIQDFSRKTNIDLSRQITGTYIVVM
ncbi:thrombospondin type 3 repeat-containing protein, partial [bacterium]|nr:thrombospondin type 3 repeat-containing protein [bacterium]